MKNKIQKIKQDFSHITPPENSKIIPLTKGKYALVDEEDYERVSQYNWCFLNNKNGYAVNGKFKMHRFVMNITDPKILVDHIFHNTLDNRKSQLRICNYEENARNVKKHKDGTSVYKGVYFDKVNNKWRATIGFQGKVINIGRFLNEVDASIAYDAKAKELYKDFSYLNHE